VIKRGMALVRIGSVRLVWLFLAALAAFVIFVECIATVGGSPDAIPHPTATAEAPATDTPVPTVAP